MPCVGKLVMKLAFTGQLASFEDKSIWQAAWQHASRTIKMFLIFIPHPVTLCLEIYPMHLIHRDKSYLHELVHCNVTVSDRYEELRKQSCINLAVKDHAFATGTFHIG